MALQNVITGSIVVGSSMTNAIILNELSLSGITTGSNLTATTLTFLVTADNINFYPLYDSTSTEVSISASSVARIYAQDPSIFYGWTGLKLREGTSASPVNQTIADSTIYFNTKKI